MAAGSSPVMPYGVLSEEDKQCSEKDLRFIAVKLADYDVSASMVSWSLQVTLDTTATATTCPLTHCDEIRQLLLKWKLQSPETGATRRQMLDFLHKLHKPSLLGEIEKYFGIERQSPSSLVALKPVSESRQPFDCESKHRLVGPNVTNLGSHQTCRQLVDNHVNPRVRQRFEELRNQFSCLVVDIQEALHPMCRIVPQLRTFLSAQLASDSFGSLVDEHCQVLSSEEIKTLCDLTTVEDIFAYLNETRAWDFLNIHLLVLVMEKFGNGFIDLQMRLKHHANEIDSFKQETPLRTFLDIWYTQVQDPNRILKMGLTRLKAKFDIPWNIDLAQFAKQQGYLCSQFLLQEHILRFVQASEGCVAAVWYVPEALEEYMVKVFKERRPDLAQGGIIELAVGSTLIFEADDEEPVSRMITHYDEYYKYSIEHPKEFWGEMAARTLVWDEPFDRHKVMEGCDMKEGKIRFFDGKLNASVNCLDRHVAAHPNKVAIIWEKNVNAEGPDKSEEKRITYRELFEDTCRIANVLKKHNVKKGDKVVIYMPAMPLAVASMLACARIGAVHNVVFAVLKTDDLTRRVVDSNAKVIITADEAIIGRDTFQLKSIVDDAISEIVSEQDEGTVCDDEQKEATSDYIVFVAERTGKKVEYVDKRDFSLKKEMESVGSKCPPVFVDSEDPLFIMYTSGSSDIPLGIVHSTAGYLLQVALTHKYVFDYKPGDIFGCMADLGWITGHSYVVYGPLCNGATTVLFEGTPHYPACDRYWEMVDRLGINQLYITPSTIRYLMKDPRNLVEKYRDKLTSLKTIATVGEPLNNNAWEWYYKNVGHERCTLVDTWWQTETGAISIVVNHNRDYSHTKSAFPPKPFFGVEPCIIDTETGEELTESNTGPQSLGYLCLKKPLPSMGRSTLSPHSYSNYFNFKIGTENASANLKGKYFTFDKAFQVEGGGYKIRTRMGDAIRMKDVWLDIPEIEGSMNMCDERILEASLVRIGHRDGQASSRFSHNNTGASTTAVGTCAFVELDPTVKPSQFPELIDKLKKTSKSILGVPDRAVPRMFIFVSDQLMTHSGKIARSLLREIIDLTQKISSLCSPRKKSAEEYMYTKGEYSHLNVYIWYMTESWKRAQ